MARADAVAVAVRAVGHPGSITKTGSTYARMLVEAARHYQRRPAVGATLPTARQASPTTSWPSPDATVVYACINGGAGRWQRRQAEVRSLSRSGRNRSTRAPLADRRR